METAAAPLDRMGEVAEIEEMQLEMAEIEDGGDRYSRRYSRRCGRRRSCGGGLGTRVGFGRSSRARLERTLLR